MQGYTVLNVRMPYYRVDYSVYISDSCGNQGGHNFKQINTLFIQKAKHMAYIHVHM